MIDRREFIAGAGASALLAAEAAARPVGPHGVAALTQGVGEPWTPAAISPVTYLDIQDLSTMRQEITGASATTPAAVDSPVGSWRSQGGAGTNWFVSPGNAQRPILRLVGGIYALQWDGVDDCMICYDAFPTGLYVAGAIQSAIPVFDNYGALLDGRPTRLGRLVNLGTNGWHDNVYPSATRKNGASLTPSATCFGDITSRFIFDATNAVGRTGAGEGRSLGPYNWATVYPMFAGYTWSFVELAAEPSNADRAKLESWLATH